MKKIRIVLLSLFCTAVLTVPVFADVVSSPVEDFLLSGWAKPVLIAVLCLLAAGIVAFVVISSRKR